MLEEKHCAGRIHGSRADAALKPRGCLLPHPVAPSVHPTLHNLTGPVFQAQSVFFFCMHSHVCFCLHLLPSSISIWFQARIQNSPHPCWIPCLIPMFRALCCRLISRHTLSLPTVLDRPLALALVLPLSERPPLIIGSPLRAGTRSQTLLSGTQNSTGFGDQ